ncbi:hypothetical protein CB1_000069001 [Camelus ferus]|nr:hypothetical protein CB1_000069001 [Camelus ferus]
METALVVAVSHRKPPKPLKGHQPRSALSASLRTRRPLWAGLTKEGDRNRCPGPGLDEAVLVSKDLQEGPQSLISFPPPPQAFLMSLTLTSSLASPDHLPAPKFAGGV